MSTYDFYIYAASALPYDPNTGTFTFASDYDFRQDRVLLSITDDDDYLDGDTDADEVGEDSNQTAVATKPDGTAVASGNVYAEQYAILEAPDGSFIYIDRIEIDGVLIGYSPSRELDPGVTYTYVSGEDIDDAPGGDPAADNRMTYSSYQAQTVNCFVSGTELLTRDGMMPVDWIGVGEALWTQDHGWQVVRWRGITPMSDAPDFPAPIEIAPGALGPGNPSATLRVSPQHRLLLSGHLCELWFGAAEVLVAASHLLHWPGIAQVSVDADYAYHHLLFDRHEILISNGTGSESLFLGPQATQVDAAPPWEVVRKLRSGHRQTARLCLTAREARVLTPGAYPATLLHPEDAPAEAAEIPENAALAG